MGKALPAQHPAVVLRSHYRQLRALLATAMIAVVGLAAAVVILATNDDAAVSPVADSAPQVTVATPPVGTRYDGGPDEGTRGILVAPPVGTRYDGGPDEGTAAHIQRPAPATVDSDYGNTGSGPTPDIVLSRGDNPAPAEVASGPTPDVVLSRGDNPAPAGVASGPTPDVVLSRGDNPPAAVETSGTASRDGGFDWTPAGIAAAYQDLRSPDTRDAARLSQQSQDQRTYQDLRSPDTTDAVARSLQRQAWHATQGYVAQPGQGLSHGGQPQPVLAPERAAVALRGSDGFDWPSAGIGAVIALGLMGASLAGLLRFRQLRQRPTQA
jgi:hypothetical protein